VNNNLAGGICVITGRLCVAIVGGTVFFDFLVSLAMIISGLAFRVLKRFYDQIARINLKAATSTNNYLKTTV
jgi:hypothetical protein